MRVFEGQVLVRNVSEPRVEAPPRAHEPIAIRLGKGMSVYLDEDTLKRIDNVRGRSTTAEDVGEWAKQNTLYCDTVSLGYNPLAEQPLTAEAPPRPEGPSDAAYRIDSFALRKQLRDRLQTEAAETEASELAKEEAALDFLFAPLPEFS